MTDHDSLAGPQDILWELGAALVDASVDTADEVVERVLAQLTTVTGALATSIWTVDAATLTAARDYRWSSGMVAELGDEPVAIEAELVDEVLSAGLSVVDLVSILGEELCAELGWTEARAALAVLDRTETQYVALVVMADDDIWTPTTFTLVRGLTVLLRQFHRRVRSERELRYRLLLEDLIASVGASLLAVGPDDLDVTIQGILDRVRVTVGARSLVLIDVIAEQRVGIPYMSAEIEIPDLWQEVDVPDISGIPGAEGRTLSDFVAETHVLDLDAIIDPIFGPETTDALGLRDPRHVVALVPAGLGSSRSMIAASRVGGVDWLPTEVDALSTLASLIAQARGRVQAHATSRSVLELQQTLAATGKAFLETDLAGADAAIHRALGMATDCLDADLAVIAANLADGTVRIEDSWSRTAGLAVPPGTVLSPEDHPLIEELTTPSPTVSVHSSSAELAEPLRDSPDARWTTAVAPVRGYGGGAAVALIWVGGDAGDRAVVRDFTHTFADLVGQLRTRLKAETELRDRLEFDAVLSQVADDFLGASLASVDAVVDRALARIGTALDLRGLVIRAVTGSSSVVEARWSREPGNGPPIGHTVGVPDDAFVDGFSGYELRYGEVEQWDGILESMWGPGSTLGVVPVYVGGDVESTVTAIGGSDQALESHETLRSFAVMLGQLRARMAEERRGRRRLESQRLLSRCAAELAETGPDDFVPAVERVLAEIAEFCELDAAFNIRVDRSSERHLARATWINPEYADALPDHAAFGEIELLDRAADTGQIVEWVDPAPTVERPTCVAVPRRGSTGIDSILFAARMTSEPWSADVLELLESLNGLLQEVEVRIAAQRYAAAAFNDAPVGIVLRDHLLNLIACNQAFADFVGADSIEELIGTRPDELYDERYEDIQWVDLDGELRAEAAFRGPGGSRVWGGMRASVVEDEVGENFWLVHVEDVTERRRAEQLLRFQASHDELTGLANRRRLLQEIHRIADGDGSVAVLLLDLDRFKIINDSLGHDRGDELLVVIADRLRLAVRPGDLVARLGGDEFAIVLPGPVSVADAEIVAERMMRLIGEPVSLGRHELYPTASIGIAVADDQTEVDDLLRRADTAMYRAKSQGRARSAAFDEALREAVTLRMATESGLRGAIRDRELVVHYQPEVSLHDGQILGAEALIRWHHPERGLLPAADFIEVAEETGLVVEIGEFVLREACREAASWPGGGAAPIVRVNLAAAQLQREDTISLVRDALARSGLPAHRLCLEITESAMMTDIRRTEDILRRLKDEGVGLAIDDFGTGFSSLAYLKRFPVDVLKIDRAFVRDLGDDPEDEAFVRSIVSLADALGLEVVAEGVETDAQAAMLRTLGCDRGQGYLFARPGPPADLLGLLRSLSG